MQNEGFDGVINTEDGEVYEYIAFEANQIKSAEENDTFDPNDDDIRYSLKEVNDRFNEQLQEDSDAAQLATEAAVMALKDAGVEVVEATPEMTEEALWRNNVIWRRKKAPETESSQDGNQPSVVSSADGTKIIINLENLTRECEKITFARTFIGDIAQALGIPKNNKRSKYATFTTVSGDIISIRVSDHGYKRSGIGEIL